MPRNWSQLVIETIKSVNNYCLGENTSKATRGTMVKILFQGLNVTCMAFLCFFSS